MESTNHAATHHHAGHEEKDFTSGIVWAVFLIFVGVVLLLNTLGVLSWGAWDLVWRFWPMLLILGGVSLLLGKSRWAGLVSVVVTVLVFFGIFSMLLIRENVWSRDSVPGISRLSDRVVQGFGDRDEQSDVVSLDALSGADVVEYGFNMSDGKFEVSKTEDGNILKVDSEFYERHGKPKVASEKDGNVLIVSFEQEEGSSVFFLGYDVPRYIFELGETGVMSRMKLNIGAGQGGVDLRGVDLAELQAEVGAGKLDVRLNESVRNEAVIEIEVGAGESVLTLPDALGYTVDYEVGVGSIELEGEDISGFGREDKKYESRNYRAAEKRVTIRAKVGAGSLTIKN